MARNGSVSAVEIRGLAEEARDMASAAKALAAAHEVLCTERWEQSRAIMQEMRADLKTLLATRDEQRGGMKLVHIMWVLFGAFCSAAAWAVARGWPHS